MKKVATFFSLLLVFLLLYAYSNQPHETMSSLYQKIPAQVRENSQLIAAYYSSQNGDREYQFAFYNPKNQTLSIYTFRISNFLKIFWDEEKSKIICKTPFNYSILATSPEKLKDFENCDNCRELLYKGKIYRNEEIVNMQPELLEVLKPDEEYWQVLIVGASELSTGSVSGIRGDRGDVFGLSGYEGLLILPTGHNATKGIIISTQPLNSTHETIKIFFPSNITFSIVRRHYDNLNFPLWSLGNLSSALTRLESFRIQPPAWRWETSISGKHAGVTWFSMAFQTWHSSRKYYRYSVYPREEWIYKGMLVNNVHTNCNGWISPYSYLYP